VININGRLRLTNSILDLILHNDNLIKSIEIHECAFSDHDFVFANIDLLNTNNKSFTRYIESRKLNDDMLFQICDKINSVDFDLLYTNNSLEKWFLFKNKILNIIDYFAPMRKVKCNEKKSAEPWFDSELLNIKMKRDYWYKKYRLNDSNNLHNFDNYKFYKNLFNSTKNEKIINYFKTKNLHDFKNNKCFWKFYSNYYKLKSDKSNILITDHIVCDDIYESEPEKISNLFNHHFTSINSINASSNTDNSNLTNHFNKFLDSSILNSNKFYFRPTTTLIVTKLINNLLASSGAGSTGIPVSIIKLCVNKFAPVLTEIFNSCIINKTIPDDWKQAVVTPLFKNKGNLNNLNNYRGISVLPPISKIFEKILATQILFILK
jgi:hypothetical protein